MIFANLFSSVALFPGDIVTFSLPVSTVYQKHLRISKNIKKKIDDSLQ